MVLHEVMMLQKNNSGCSQVNLKVFLTEIINLKMIFYMKLRKLLSAWWKILQVWEITK